MKTIASAIFLLLVMPGCSEVLYKEPDGYHITIQSSGTRSNDKFTYALSVDENGLRTPGSEVHKATRNAIIKTLANRGYVYSDDLKKASKLIKLNISPVHKNFILHTCQEPIWVVTDVVRTYSSDYDFEKKRFVYHEEQKPIYGVRGHRDVVSREAYYNMNFDVNIYGLPAGDHCSPEWGTSIEVKSKSPFDKSVIPSLSLYVGDYLRNVNSNKVELYVSRKELTRLSLINGV